MSKNRTSGTIHRKRAIASLLLAGYLCGIIIGSFVIWLIPVTKNKADLLEIAYDKGQEILSAGLMDKVMIFGMEHYFYADNCFFHNKTPYIFSPATNTSVIFTPSLKTTISAS